MRKNAKFKSAVGLISALLILAGLVYGCYSRGSGIEEKNKYDQEIKPDPLSETELRKFAASVRKVDGEAEAHYKLALYFQERWRHKLAIDELKQVLLRDPVHARAYNALGVSSDNLGDHDAAIDYYKLALQIDSKLDYAYNNLGYSYLLKGDNQRAVEAFQQAIALNGKEKRYRNNLGLAYAKQDKYELAFEQFSAVDSEANAEKTFAKVMTDLGKGTNTEKALLAIKSAPKREEIAQLSPPVSKLPELSAQPSETTSGHDPVERFQSTKESIHTPPDEKIQAVAQESEISEPSDTASAESAGNDSEELVAEVKEESLKGPVIDIPAPPTQTNPHKAEIASVLAAIGHKNAAIENKDEVQYYHIASLALSPDAVQGTKAASANIIRDEHRANPLIHQLREIMPPHFEIVSSTDQEKHEERILVASSSTKAAGWQNAPQPKQTLERSIVEIEVQNGNGVKNSARKVADHLRKNGFNVVRIDDAQSHDHFITKVFYYSGNLKEAQRLLKAIPEITSDAELYELQSMGNHIRLLIGKDLVNRNKALAWNELYSN